MNLAKQGHTNSIFRNQRHFCTPTMKSQKQKSGKNIPFDIEKRKTKYLIIKLTEEVEKIFTQKTVQHWRKNWGKNLKETQIHGNIYLVHGSEELTSSECPYYPKQFIDSMQSLLKYQWYISQIKNKHFKNLHGTINNPK